MSPTNLQKYLRPVFEMMRSRTRTAEMFSFFTGALFSFYVAGSVDGFKAQDTNSGIFYAVASLIVASFFVGFRRAHKEEQEETCEQVINFCEATQRDG